MKWLRLHTAILSFFIVLIAGTGISLSHAVEVKGHSQALFSFGAGFEKAHAVEFRDEPKRLTPCHENLGELFKEAGLGKEDCRFPAEAGIPQSFPQYVFTGFNAINTNNMMASAPAASVVTPLLPQTPGASPDKTGTGFLNNLIHRKNPTFPSRTQQLPSRPFSKRASLLPIAGGTAICAP